MAKLEIWDDILKMLSINTDCEAIIIDVSFIKLHQHEYGEKRGHFKQSIGQNKRHPLGYLIFNINKQA